MKKTLLFSFFTSFVFLQASYGQTGKVWSDVKKGSFEKRNTIERVSFPTSYLTRSLDLSSMTRSLLAAPERNSGDYSTVIVEIPNASGNLEKFRMYEASNFDSDLQAQFPGIRSYVGEGIDDKFARLRLSLDPKGIQGVIFRTGKRNEFLEPISKNGEVYAVYSSGREKGKLPFTCSTQEQTLASDFSDRFSEVGRSSASQLLTFRLALSCTAEYANYFGATSASDVALVMAAYNATMTRVNGVFENDFAIHMNIVSQSTNVIYYNASTDPYSDASSGASGAWNTELQNTLSSSLTGASTSITANNAAYDVGHLFGASGGGGNAGCIGCVCVNDTLSPLDENKGSGFTSPADGVPAGDNFDIDYVAHEMGHQFGANHTFSMSYEGYGANMEVGSGSTIMGYAGITSQDVQSHSDDYFHAVSIAQVQSNMATKSCPTSTAITHGAPVVNAGADYTIPKSTPFMLTGSATDIGGGNLTYCWEQYDDSSGTLTGANSAASETKTSGPNWRSYDPVTSPTRYFPNMTSVLSGSTTTDGDAILVEALSSVARTLSFRLTVRDNVVGQGQTGYDNVIVTVSGTKGPLTVTSQNTTGIVWTPGTTETITWTVNNTNTISGGDNVDILLSTDGGQTWGTTLVSATANDGSETITVPNVTAANCRVMVKASANIFFNVNLQNIAVGDYTYQAQNVCEDYTFNLNASIAESTANSYAGYNLPITDSFVITDINYYADVTHPSIGQVNILLKQPWEDTSAGLITALWYNNTCTTADLDKWFDTSGVAVDCAQTTTGSDFVPYSIGNINAGVGQNSAGTWGFTIKMVLLTVQMVFLILLLFSYVMQNMYLY
ncbi:reprolysin-like metallopeptidase [Flavobacterium sediminis]|nr:zinc-dependent metalloprotease family protein [Flavobacterium sediminis]